MELVAPGVCSVVLSLGKQGLLLGHRLLPLLAIGQRHELGHKAVGSSMDIYTQKQMCYASEPNPSLRRACHGHKSEVPTGVES